MESASDSSDSDSRDSDIQNRNKDENFTPAQSQGSMDENTRQSDNDDSEIENQEHNKDVPASPNGSENSSKVGEKNKVSPTSSDSESENLKDEENSDYEIDYEKDTKFEKTKISHNVSHEDLSDVSLESEDENAEGNEPVEEAKEMPLVEAVIVTDLREKLLEKKNNSKIIEEKQNNSILLENSLIEKKNDEDALDFEAEEGECGELNMSNENMDVGNNDDNKQSDNDLEDGEELEEGEVSDEDEKRPEETEPKPVCRFYTRGQCTWGMSCRFLHPGVTDKGNYTMFDMVRPVPISHQVGFPPYSDYRQERPSIHHMAASHAAYAVSSPAVAARVPEPIATESAWERGLRTAKEMMRKANKRKEQDMDFEDKKMNLSLSQEEMEKDNYYTREPEVAPYDYSPPNKVPRAGITAAIFDEDAFGRTQRYRELPAHRMPHYEDDDITKQRVVRPQREVILQRADEWNDPWMRSKSPQGEKRSSRRDRRSYSSNSSYSSSSSTRSGSSSDSSRSSSALRRKRYDSHRSKDSDRHAPKKDLKTRTPSPTPRRTKYSPARKASPVAKRYEKKKSPVVVKKPSSGTLTERKKRRSSSSVSGSSSSGTESESSYSSSTDTSREKKSTKKPKNTEKPAKTSKKGDAKKEAEVLAASVASASANSKKSSRREELLKQLRAVEDAIARKRSRIN